MQLQLQTQPWALNNVPSPSPLELYDLTQPSPLALPPVVLAVSKGLGRMEWVEPSLALM